MRNICVKCSFCGTAYHGFQRQNNSVAVQNVIEASLTRITKADVHINGCSRTDTGVHAREFYFSFRTDSPIPCSGLVKALNSILPGDIAVSGCADMDDGFHARYSCKGKEYEYMIYNAAVRDPFLDNRALHYPYKLDTERIAAAGKYLTGRHDFSSFCGYDGLKEDNVRTVTDLRVSRDADMVSVFISADGFLYNMVRIIIGTLLDVNEGRREPDDMPLLLEKKDRCCAGDTAPAYGLYLNRVFY